MEYEKEFPRFFDLMRTYEFTTQPGSLFYEFEKSLEQSRLKLSFYRYLEAELAQLDITAWKHLKKKMSEAAVRKQDTHGWHQVIACVHEAQAYNYLRRIGTENIQFVKSGNFKSPDLRGTIGKKHIVCECKTLNRSKKALIASQRSQVQAVSLNLDDAFMTKIRSVIERGFLQIEALGLNDEAMKILYLVPNFDDMQHTYVDDYMKQIRDFFNASDDLPHIDYVFDVKSEHFSILETFPRSRHYLFNRENGWRQIE